MTLTTNPREAALAATDGTVETAERVKRAVMRLRAETPDMPLTTAWDAATREVEAEIRAQRMRLASR